MATLLQTRQGRRTLMALVIVAVLVLLAWTVYQQVHRQHTPVGPSARDRQRDGNDLLGAAVAYGHVRDFKGRVGRNRGLWPNFESCLANSGDPLLLISSRFKPQNDRDVSASRQSSSATASLPQWACRGCPWLVIVA